MAVRGDQRLPIPQMTLLAFAHRKNGSWGDHGWRNTLAAASRGYANTRLQWEVECGGREKLHLTFVHSGSPWDHCIDMQIQNDVLRVMRIFTLSFVWCRLRFWNWSHVLCHPGHNFSSESENKMSKLPTEVGVCPCHRLWRQRSYPRQKKPRQPGCSLRPAGLDLWV